MKLYRNSFKASLTLFLCRSRLRPCAGTCTCGLVGPARPRDAPRAPGVDTHLHCSAPATWKGRCSVRPVIVLSQDGSPLFSSRLDLVDGESSLGTALLPIPLPSLVVPQQSHCINCVDFAVAMLPFKICSVPHACRCESSNATWSPEAGGLDHRDLAQSRLEPPGVRWAPGREGVLKATRG